MRSEERAEVEEVGEKKSVLGRRNSMCKDPTARGNMALKKVSIRKEWSYHNPITTNFQDLASYKLKVNSSLTHIESIFNFQNSHPSLGVNVFPLYHISFLFWAGKGNLHSLTKKIFCISCLNVYTGCLFNVFITTAF